MALVPYTITALAESAAQGTDGKNIVAGATCSMYSQPSDTVVTLYDDASGSNGSTSKVTGANGQVVVYAEQGRYRVNVNASDSFVTVSSDVPIDVDTFANLAASSPVQDGQRFICQERANANYILQPSGYVALTGDVTFANGRIGALQIDGKARLGWFGAIGPLEIASLLGEGVEFETPNRVSSLRDIGARWFSGYKAPIAFFGDSTTDGVSTTTDGTSNATFFNGDQLVLGDIPEGYSVDQDESNVPNSYCSILQRLAREFFDNNSVRVYNAGYRGQQLASGWASRNVAKAVYEHPVYQDCEMIGFMFGINDVANGSDSQQLISEHYTQTKALCIDALNRGIQPFLVTCSVTGSKENSSFSMRRISSTVNQQKERLSRELNLELVDITQFTEEYIYNNGEGRSYYDLGPDGVHLKDLGNLKQAQFLLKEIAGDQLFVHAGSSLGYFDITHKAVRTLGLSGNMSGSFTINRGLNQKYRNIRLSPSELDDSSGNSVLTAYIWCDYHDSSLVYNRLTNEGVDGSAVTDYNDVLQWKLTTIWSQVGKIDEEVTIEDPDSKGTPVAYIRLDTPMYMGKLQYGLNKIEILVPDTFNSSYISGDYYYFGSFHITPDSPESEPSITNTTDHTNELYLNYFNKRPWTNVLQKTGTMSLPDLTTNTSDLIPYNPSVGNRGSLLNPLDWVEVKLNCGFTSNSGVVLGYNLDNNNSLPDVIENNSSLPDPVFKRRSYTSGDKMILTAGATNLFFNVRTPLESSLFSFDTGVAWQSYKNKDLIIRLERNALNVGVTVSLIDGENWTELWTRSIGSSNGASQGQFEQWVATFIVGEYTLMVPLWLHIKLYVCQANKSKARWFQRTSETLNDLYKINTKVVKDNGF